MLNWANNVLTHLRATFQALWRGNWVGPNSQGIFLVYLFSCFVVLGCHKVPECAQEKKGLMDFLILYRRNLPNHLPTYGSCLISTWKHFPWKSCNQFLCSWLQNSFPSQLHLFFNQSWCCLQFDEPNTYRIIEAWPQMQHEPSTTFVSILASWQESRGKKRKLCFWQLSYFNLCVRMFLLLHKRFL